MDWQRILDWLFSEAGAGWVFGIVSLCVLVVSRLRNRAQKIIVRDISWQTLVLVDSRVREKIKVLFRDEPIYRLSQYEAEIVNSGKEVITNPTITINASEGRLLDVSLNGEFGEQQASVEVQGSLAKLYIPYLNPYGAHKHSAQLSVMADCPLSKIGILGTGEGWSLERQSMRSVVYRTTLYGGLAIVCCLVWVLGYAVVRGYASTGLTTTDLLFLLPPALLLMVPLEILSRNLPEVTWPSAIPNLIVPRKNRS